MHYLALLSGSETFVHYTVQIYYPVREKLFSFSIGPAPYLLPKSAGGPQTAAMYYFPSISIFIISPSNCSA